MNKKIQLNEVGELTEEEQAKLIADSTKQIDTTPNGPKVQLNG